MDQTLTCTIKSPAPRIVSIHVKRPMPDSILTLMRFEIYRSVFLFLKSKKKRTWTIRDENEKMYSLSRQKWTPHWAIFARIFESRPIRNTCQLQWSIHSRQWKRTVCFFYSKNSEKKYKNSENSEKNQKNSENIFSNKKCFRSKCTRVKANPSAQVSGRVGQGKRDAVESVVVKCKIIKPLHGNEIWMVITIYTTFLKLFSRLFRFVCFKIQTSNIFLFLSTGNCFLFSKLKPILTVLSLGECSTVQ